MMIEKKLRYEKSAQTVSKKLNEGWFSKRVHGTLVTIRDKFQRLMTRVKPIVNNRPHIRRNQLVRVGDNPPIKFKHTTVYRDEQAF